MSEIPTTKEAQAGELEVQGQNPVLLRAGDTPQSEALSSKTIAISNSGNSRRYKAKKIIAHQP